MVAVTASVQKLQTNFTAILVDGIGYLTVFTHVPGLRHFTAKRRKTPTKVRADTAGDNKANTTFGTLFIKAG